MLAYVRDGDIGLEVVHDAVHAHTTHKVVAPQGAGSPPDVGTLAPIVVFDSRAVLVVLLGYLVHVMVIPIPVKVYNGTYGIKSK